MMERIAVFSDTHGSTERMLKALEQIEPVDRVFHLGDNIKDAISLSDRISVPVTCVMGNCDFNALGNSEETVYVCGKKLLLVHGHRQSVKYGMDRLYMYAQSQGADAVFFGHTHMPSIQYKGRMLLMNPGSLKEPRKGDCTFGVVTVSEDGIFPEIMKFVF